MLSLIPSGPEKMVPLRDGGIKSDEDIKDILGYFWISGL